MPHVVIKCYKGRSREQLKQIAEEVARNTAKAFDLKESSVSVAIEEVEKEQWSDVYHNEIYADSEKLFVEPGYKM